MSRRHRVLVVDDSAFARKVIREVLERSGEFEVVGIARDGLEALEAIAELAPDVITLDLVMPELDGLGVLDALGARAPPVVVVSISGRNTQLGAAALLKGAIEIVEKPSALAIDRLYEMSDELVEKVRIAATAHPLPRKAIAPPELQVGRRSRFGLIAIGASTGGPGALRVLITALPAELPVPVVAALHIPDGYTGALAERLAQESRIRVSEGRHGTRLEPGKVVLVPGGVHSQVIASQGELLLSVSRTHRSERAFTPSIDLLFESAAIAASPVLGVVLTGMGNDGTHGAKTIRDRGGAVVVESQESCVVYGMPRAVIEAGASDGSAPITEMSEWIIRRLSDENRGPD